MVTRRFTAADIAAVREIDRLAFTPDEQYEAEFYGVLAGSRDHDAIVLQIADGTVVGWILAYITPEPLRIRSLAVHSQFRRRGFGERLVLAILGRHRREADLLVDPANCGAIALYRKLGFVETDADPEMPERTRMLRRAETLRATQVLVREEQSADIDAIRAVHDAAFGGDAEGRLVDLLRNDALIVSSVVALLDGRVVASAVFSRLPIHTPAGVVHAAALAPVGVAPEYQGRGLGTEVINHGLRACVEQGYPAVIVLGSPRYYARFGFSHELARSVRSPYSGAGAAWMALELRPSPIFAGDAEAKYPGAFAVVD